MYDKIIAKEVLNQILNASNTIVKRCAYIENADDFLCNEIGLEKLDAICMQLIAIGESLKNMDKITNRSLFKRYPQIDWKKAKGMRDIITHHYFDLDAEIVYDVCKNEIPKLIDVVQTILDKEFP
jgi:uncharacterized protein with HEPN domain